MNKFFNSEKLKTWDEIEKDYKDLKKKSGFKIQLFGIVVMLFCLVGIYCMVTMTINSNNQTLLVENREEETNEMAKSIKEMAETMKIVDKILEDSIEVAIDIE